MSSFYGGRPGNPFSIVATFGSVNAMVTQFRKGPNYVAVHYDEHVSISSSDSDNGNVYRRGYNYTNNMGGAELVGNLLKGSSGGTNAELIDIRTGYDGTTYNSAGEAVREQVVDLNESLNEKFLIGKNKFNPYYTELAGYVINDATGTISQNGDGMVSDKIKTNGAAKAIISYVTSWGAQQNKAFNVYQYRFDNTFIEHDVDSVIMIDNECDYIRIYTSNAYVPTDVRKRIMVELTDLTATTFSEYEKYYEYLNPDISVKEGLTAELLQLDDTTESLSQKFLLGKNKFNPDTALLNYTINTSTGEVIEASGTGTLVSDKIRTNGAAKAITSYVSTTGTQSLQNLRVFQYRADGGFIKYTETGVNTLTSDCAYIRLYTPAAFATEANRCRIMVELTDIDAVTYTDFRKFKISMPRNLLGAVIPVSSIMSKVILAPKRLKIKLIGDSITQGVSSSDYNAAGDVIISDNPSQWRRNVGTKSWASMFKSYVERTYNAEVINNGVRGCSTHQILYYWNELIDGTEDIVIVMLGTNNRMNENGQWLLYNDLQTIKDKIEANGSEVIFMSAPPASNNDETREDGSGNPVMHFHMNDVDDVICKLASENNREYISLYKKTINYMEETDTSIDDLLADGLHPNDRLYALMFGWVMDGLGLSRKIDGATW